MKKNLLLIILLVAFSALHAQTEIAKDSTDSNLKTKLRLIEARKLFFDNNVRAALLKYREILEENENNLMANIRLAECYYSLKNYKIALKYAEKSWKLSADYENDLIYIYAKCLHRAERLNEAIEKFELLNSQTTNGEKKEYEIQKQIEECRLAQLLIKNPLDVKIINFGKQINSKTDDYSPAITSDGKIIYFTSRRDNIENGGRIDELGDQKYFEDIYYTTYNDSLGEWEKATLIPGRVNTPGHDAVLSVAPDGNSLYVYKNNEDSYGDIFIARKSLENKKWREPKPLEKPVNSSYFESSCSITADGKYLYFISERPEGSGQGDIYVCEKITSTTWTKPINLGNLVNTPSDEKFVFVTPDGNTLYFSSDGHPGMGSYDIFKSEKSTAGMWTSPTNIGYPINTVNEESTFSISSDLKNFYISAEYKDTEGERDIYQIKINDALAQFRKVANIYRGVLNITVKAMDGGGIIPNAKVKLILNEDSHLVLKENCSASGVVNFYVINEKKYNFEADAEGFKTAFGSAILTTKNNNFDTEATILEVIELEKK